MATDTEFVAACRDHVGDALRVVTAYDDEGYETLYRRDDVRLGGNRLAALVAAARDVHSPLRLLASDGGALGGYRSSVHTFGDAVVLQFLVGRRRGYLACVDKGAGVGKQEVVEALDEAAERSA